MIVMEHLMICEQEIIEKYILHQLSNKQVDEFEEHLLYCSQCRDELVELKKTIGLVQYSAKIYKNQDVPDELNKVSNKTVEIRTMKAWILGSTWIKIAAITLLIFSICSVFYLFHNDSNITTIYEKNDEIATSQLNKNTSPITRHQSNTNNIPKTGQPKTNNKGSESYKESPIYENAIENTLRSGNLEIISPIKSEKLTADKILIFKWKGEYQKLKLSILNNKEKTIFEKPVQSPFQLPVALEKGLYYWQLEDEDEVVYVGRFFIN
jgi:hypothetical protein